MNEVQFGSVNEYIESLKNGVEGTVAVADVIAALESIPTRATRTSGQRRGQLAGLSIDEMSLEQLKREKINASSVLYKAKQRGAAEETITKNQARVDAVNARLAELEPAKVEEAPAAEGDGSTNDAVEGEL